MKPDTILIAISCADGKLSIMEFVTREIAPNGETSWTREPTPENIGYEIYKTYQTQPEKLPVSWRIIKDRELPEDRYFRDAWKDVSKKIEIDMPKAREIHRQNLREKRAMIFPTLDIEYIKADEVGDTTKKAKIAAHRQALRDVTDDPRIEQAKTPEELRAVIPESLTKGQ